MHNLYWVLCLGNHIIQSADREIVNLIGVDLCFYLISIIEGSLFKALRHFFAFCCLCACWQQADNNNWCLTHMHAHYSPTGIGSRRSFAFALIGCIIWDTSSGVKPSEEEKEEAWEACALGGGWVSITSIKLNCPWFKYIYTVTPETIILFNQEVPRDRSSQGDFFFYTCLVLILAEEKKKWVLEECFHLKWGLLLSEFLFNCFVPLRTLSLCLSLTQLIPGEHTGRIRYVGWGSTLVAERRQQNYKHNPVIYMLHISEENQAVRVAMSLEPASS